MCIIVKVLYTGYKTDQLFMSSGMSRLQTCKVILNISKHKK